MTPENQFERTELLLGKEGVDALKQARIAIFGIGGVGGYVAEALARSGVGCLDLIDKDKVSLTNINRQIIATHKTVGQLKTEAMKERILDINPNAVVNTYPCFFLPETAGNFDFTQYSYVVDAVDTVTAKVSIVMEAKSAGVPVISSMGAGNKLNPCGFLIGDIYETKICPLARVMRRELKKKGVDSLKAVYSLEEPVKPLYDIKEEGRRATPGSVAFVPSAAGLILAGEVVRDLVYLAKSSMISPM